MNSLEFATIIASLSWRSGCRILDLQTAVRFGRYNRLWNKRQAARIAFAANYEEREAYGKGNRWQRRVAEWKFNRAVNDGVIRISPCYWYEDVLMSNETKHTPETSDDKPVVDRHAAELVACAADAMIAERSKAQ